MTVRWGMLSTAGIGRVVAAALSGSTEAELVAVAGRDAGKAAAYAAELGVPRSYGSYAELVTADDIDAVYIPLPNSLHTEWTLAALRAGKHVLCEKPFALTAADAATCFDAADAAGRLCIEGLMWRQHPQTLLAQRLVAEGAIGELALVRAALAITVDPGDIRRIGALGGGALLDLGCYCLSAIRLFGGEPLTVSAARVVDSAPGAAPGDMRLAATLTLPNRVLGQFDVALDHPRRDELELVGTAGRLVVPDPWICRSGYLELHRDGAVERIPVDVPGPAGRGEADPGQTAPEQADPEHDAYRIEFENASRAIATGTPPPFGRADAVAQAAAIEAVRAASETGTVVAPTEGAPGS